jgi:hypothetical protein
MLFLVRKSARGRDDRRDDDRRGRENRTRILTYPEPFVPQPADYRRYIVRIYLSSPTSQMQAHLLAGRRVLLSYAMRQPVIVRDYVPTFRALLLDSGAYSEFTTGVKVDLTAYIEWAAPLLPQSDAVAGLDDLSGDWRRSLVNYATFPESFPTYHLTDPPELLDDLVQLASERNRWLGVGMCGRQTHIDPLKERWLRSTLDRIREREPRRLHVHGWALTRYAHCPGLNSVDSSRWVYLAQSIKTHHNTCHLSMAECVSIAIKQILRAPRSTKEPPVDEPSLFGNPGGLS